MGNAFSAGARLVVRRRRPDEDRVRPGSGSPARATASADADVREVGRRRTRLATAAARACDSRPLDTGRRAYAHLPTGRLRVRTRRHGAPAVTGRNPFLDGAGWIDAAAAGATRARRLSPAALASCGRCAFDTGRGDLGCR